MKHCAPVRQLSSTAVNASKQSSIVSKCVRVIDLVVANKSAPSFSEIVEQSGYAKSSVHRILGILQHEGLVEFDRQTRTYRLGPKTMRWASSSWQNADIQRAADGLLEALSRTSGSNVALAIRDGFQALYLRAIDNYYLSYVPRAGDRGPLHCTAVGKVLLAFQPEPQRRQAVENLELTKFTDRTIIDRVAFKAELERVTGEGFAEADGEEFLQVCGIAAPLFDFQGDVAGSVCIWSHSERSGLDDLKRHLPGLLDTCTKISGRCGFNGNVRNDQPDRRRHAR